MKGKRGSGYLVIIFLISLIFIHNAYALDDVCTDLSDINCCNIKGGIMCADGCMGAGSFKYTATTKDCAVTKSQNVTLDYGWQNRISTTNLKIYEINSIQIAEGVTLQFYATDYNAHYTNPSLEKAADARCAKDEEFAGKSYPTALYGASNDYTAAKGGAGGAGGYDSDGYAHGGAGGAGAGGGAIGYAGGDGFTTQRSYSGGAGSEPWELTKYMNIRGPCGGNSELPRTYSKWETSNSFGGYNGGRAGGLVQIKAKTITINGIISVNGEDGYDGRRGYDNDNGRGTGGFGGGPGSGGGGAGEIVLMYDTLSGKGTISANGGKGGNGGMSGNGRDRADGGGGGGGGGGAGGIIGLVKTSGTTTFPTECNGGKGGEGGVSQEESKYGKQGGKGNDGPAGQCKASEMDPLGVADINPGRCSDGIDNDHDTVFDMDDPDCHDAEEWDASAIWDLYPKTDYNPSGNITNSNSIKDLACGDDTGKCITNPAYVSAAKCKVKPGVNIADLCIRKTCSKINSMGLYYEYNCGCQEDSYTAMIPVFCEAIPDMNNNEASNCEVKYNYIYDTFAGDICGAVGTTQATCVQRDYCYWEEAYDSGCEDNWNRATCEEGDECLWNQGQPSTADLGFTTPDKKYLCIDSMDRNGAFSSLGTYYKWIDASESLRTTKTASQNVKYIVFQADNTQFISNDGEWFYCGASGTTPAYNANKINEYGTFTQLTNADTFTCQQVLETAEQESQEDAKVIACPDEFEDGECEQQCNDDDKCVAYCREASFQAGEFVNTCYGQCFFKPVAEGGEYAEYDELENVYANPGRLENLCKSKPYEPPCGDTARTTARSDLDFIETKICKQFPELCIRGIIPSEKTCEGVHTSINYPYVEDKICSSTEYCENGNFVKTNDGNCCFGADSYCETYEPAMCEDIGGTVKPDNCETCVCTSQISISDCCIAGSWVDQSLLDLNVNNAFICYKQGNRSMIQECCGLAGCKNLDNPLNDKTSTSPKLYSLDGVPLFTFLTFDNKNDDMPMAYTKTYLNGFRSGAKISLKGQKGFPVPQRYDINWSTFNSLEFDILYNADIDYNVSFVDTDGTICDYNLKDYISIRKGPGRWQHVVINLQDSAKGIMVCSAGALNTNKIKDLTITVGGDTSGVTIALDNFFLRSDGTGLNSETRFCSGNWGDWVENLDGPNADDQQGFFKSSYTATDKSNISVYGPYRDACEGVISFGWTGSACCGDDTKTGSYGELWSDTKGICWNGTVVYSDNTVAYSLGIVPGNEVVTRSPAWNNAVNEKNLLFYKGTMYSCNRDVANYNSMKISYDGDNTVSNTLNVEEKNKVASYTIRGHYMCTPDGWIHIDDVKKTRILAANLMAVAKQEGSDYTLACGEDIASVNLLSEEADDYTDNVCVLRTGDNVLDDEKVIIGLEANVNFEDYMLAMKNAYPAFKLKDGQTCGNLPKDSVEINSFFTKCAEDENGFKIYYSAPLNLIILSDGTIHASSIDSTGSTSMLQNMWDGFRSFFSNLFGANSDKKLLSFEEDVKTKDFYISVQGDKAIRGFFENAGRYTFIRAEYDNMSVSVEKLANATRANLVDDSNAMVDYIPETATNKKQIIFVNTTSEDLDWKKMTSILRLNAD